MIIVVIYHYCYYLSYCYNYYHYHYYSTAPRIPPGLGMVHWSCWMTLGLAWLKRPQDSFKLVFLSQSGPNLGPSWLQVGSSWAHVGPKLAPSWLKLAHLGSKLATSENHPCNSMPYLSKPSMQ